jgi:hypothetical protein
LKLAASYLNSAQTIHNFFRLYKLRFSKFFKGPNAVSCETPKQEKVTTKHAQLSCSNSVVTPEKTKF